MLRDLGLGQSHRRRSNACLMAWVGGIYLDLDVGLLGCLWQLVCLSLPLQEPVSIPGRGY